MAFPLPSPLSDLKVPISQVTIVVKVYCTIQTPRKCDKIKTTLTLKKKVQNLVTKWRQVIRACAINNFNGNVNMLSKRLQTTAENSENSLRSRPFNSWRGGGDFWSSRIFFSSNLLGRIFFPISCLLHLCTSACRKFVFKITHPTSPLKS